MRQIERNGFVFEEVQEGSEWQAKSNRISINVYNCFPYFDELEESDPEKEQNWSWRVHISDTSFSGGVPDSFTDLQTAINLAADFALYQLENAVEKEIDFHQKRLDEMKDALNYLKG